MTKSFDQQRIASLSTWAQTACIPGMHQSDYIDILNYVLSNQEDDGGWTVQGALWKTVMTAVILKALAALEFKPGDQWPRQNKSAGGLDLALQFLVKQARQAGVAPQAIGEDIWDACQTIVALQKFGKADVAAPLAQKLSRDWENLYQASVKTKDPVRWCGPAYLAAMIDVIGADDAGLGIDKYLSSYNYLLSQVKELPETGQMYFPAATPVEDMDLWNTSLTLRTLSSPPPTHKNIVDRDKLKMTSSWLIRQLDTGAWRRHADIAEKPMLLARSLQGLRAARRWLDGEMREKIDTIVVSGNQEIVSLFREPARVGNLKAYSAVVEYLSDWTVRVSAGLAFQASKSLVSMAVLRREPRPLEGGIRIAWISDLHVTGDQDGAPGYFNLPQRFAGRFMHMNGTPLTKYLQAGNLQTILDQIRDIRPIHILVTGDLTNYAEDSQYKTVHDQFLALQSQLRSSDVSSKAVLDPRLWTLLPGNHDVTSDGAAKCKVRYNLGRFFKWFGSTFSHVLSASEYDAAFPISKEFVCNDGYFKVRLIGLDSTVESPVWHVGVNARGRIDDEQSARLLKLLADRSNSELILVALHHHPIVVPELVSGLEDYFLSLDERQGRALIQACATNDVSAILHGHFHHFSNWSGLTPQRQKLTIIGSPAGSLVMSGTGEEFLELREAEQETPESVQRGLALYSHKIVDSKWTSSYIGIFLPIVPRVPQSGS